MTQDDVIVLWKDANGWDVRGYKNTLEDLERFANLVAKHTLMNIDPSKFISCQEVMEAARMAEREACAKVCEQSEIPIPIDVWLGSTKKEISKHTALALANYIRARGEQA